MTKQEAYRTFRCWHCVFCDNDEGICTAGNPESDNCPKDDRVEMEVGE